MSKLSPRTHDPPATWPRESSHYVCARAQLDVFTPTDDDTSGGGRACAYCTGNDAATLSRFMIGCDECGRWYHGPCVAVDKASAGSMDQYMCPECARLAGKTYAFGTPPPAPRRTRRPRLRYVTSLLAEAEGIGVELPEEGHIRSLHAAATVRPFFFSSPSPPRVTHPSTWQEWERSAEAMSARGDRLGESEWHAIQTLEVTCLMRKDAILMR